MMKTGLLSFPVTCLLAAVPCLFAQGSISPATPIPVIKTGTTNVLVDVVVTDHHGVPVDNLTQDSFTIKENGHPQQIVSFEAHLPPASLRTAEPSSLPPGVYSNMQAAPDGGAVDVLLIDSLNTPAQNQVQAHRQLVQYLRTLPIGKPLAVFTLSGQLHQLEDFTTDHTALLKAVEEFTRSPQKSPLLKTKEDTAAEMKNEDQAIEITLSLRPGTQGLAQAWLLALQQFEADQESFNVGLRVQYTLDALDRLARYLSGIPGRKNVIWLSGSFPLSVLPDFDLKNPFEAATDFSSKVDRTAGLLANAHVALYPIDARGLFPQWQSNPSMSGGSAARNPDRITKAESAEFSRNAEEQMSLEKFAHATGGKAIYNTNDLKGAIAEVDRDGSHYYSLAYVPSDKGQDNKVRRIDVQVDSGKFNLSYRRSYTPTEISRPETVGKDFVALLRHDAPPSTQILFRVHPGLMSPQPNATSPTIGDNPSPKRPVLRYSIEWNIEAAPVALTASADGVLHGATTLLTIAYDRNGKALNSTSTTLSINVHSGDYPKFLKGGIHYSQKLDVPVHADWLRAGILDPASGRMGSLEVPFSVKVATH